jgi:hypothetical protein
MRFPPGFSNNQPKTNPMKKSKKKIKVRDLKPKKNPKAGSLRTAPQGISKGNLN